MGESSLTITFAKASLRYKSTDKCTDSIHDFEKFAIFEKCVCVFVSYNIMFSSDVKNFYVSDYYGDNNFLICNALLARDCKIMVVALTLRQKFRRAFNIRPTSYLWAMKYFRVIIAP